MIIYVLSSLCLLAALISLGIYLYFRDKQLARVHENKLTLEVLAASKATSELVVQLSKAIVTSDNQTTQTLENYRITLVEVLKDMREIVKETEHERKRVAANAAATLLRPGGTNSTRQGRLPQP